MIKIIFILLIKKSKVLKTILQWFVLLDFYIYETSKSKQNRMFNFLKFNKIELVCQLKEIAYIKKNV